MTSSVGALADSESPSSALAAIVAEVERDTCEIGEAVDRRFLTEVIRPLAEAVAAAAGAHRRLASDRSAGDGDRRYRRDLVKGVVTPLREALARIDCGHAVVAAVEDAERAAAEIVSRMPDIVTVPEEDDLYTAEPDDSPLVGFRKVLIRAGRRVQALGGPRQPRQRSVPVRALVVVHVTARFESAVHGATRDVQETIGGIVGTLEARVSDLALEVIQPDAPDDSTVQAGVQRLQEALEALGSEAEAVRPDLISRLPSLSMPLRDDFRRAGTFMLRRSVSRSSGRAPAKRWGQWHQNVVNRFVLIERLNEVYDDLLRLRDELVQDVRRRAVEPLRQGVLGLARAIDVGAEATHTALQRRSPGEVVAALDEVREDIRSELRSGLRSTPVVTMADDVLAHPGREQWDELMALAGRLPAALAVHVPNADPNQPINPTQKSLVINLSAITNSALQPPWVEQLAGPAEAIQRAVVRTWSEAETVEDIVAYNFDEAIAEIQRAVNGAPEATTPTDALTSAAELTTDALRRSAELLDALASALEAPVAVFEDAVMATVSEDWADVVRGVRVEDALEERWVGFQTFAVRWVESTWVRVRDAGRDAWSVTRKRVVTTYRMAQQLLSEGRAAVGVAEEGVPDAVAALRPVLDAPAMIARLPLVYRKLFSFGPINNAALLQGRARELVRVRQAIQAWQDGDPGALIVHAPLGSGLTSFLAVLGGKVLEHLDVRRLTLEERVETEAAFAALVAGALDLPHTAAPDLETLGRHLQEGGPADRRTVCLIDNLEHVVLQTLDGSDLIGRVLRFFSRTDGHVFWLAAMGQEAWHFVERTMGAAASAVAVYPLDRLDAGELADIIMSRHRRMGTPLVFQRPAEPSTLLRQRLRRARTSEREQEVLGDHYFERLERLAGQDIVLALFYWLRSADFGDDEDVLCVRPIEAVDFRFLRSFDLEKQFTLKAFVLHNTLTVEEHARVFRFSEDQSTFVLESLLNMRLIEPARADGSAADHRILPAVRYRIRRLVLHPVVEHLRSKNVIY